MHPAWLVLAWPISIYKMCWPYAYLVILWPFGSLDATELVLVKRALDNREVELKELKTALRAIRLTDTDQIARLDIIESNINNLISGFSARLTSNEYALTPREIQIAALIKDGKTTKEIAEYLSVSTASIDFHRNNIRTQLGLKNKKVNLRSFLISLS